MKLFGVIVPTNLTSLNRVFKNPVNLLIAAIVVYVVYTLYQQYEGFADQTPSLVLYHLPSCGHCTRMMPEWDTLQDKYARVPSVNVSKVDCSMNPDEAEKNGIGGFPTIILFKDGQKKVYEGERTAAGLEAFISA